LGTSAAGRAWLLREGRAVTASGGGGMGKRPAAAVATSWHAAAWRLMYIGLWFFIECVV
jgi:hypothetical protein